MTADLITFLSARLDEDSLIARAATPGPWEVDNQIHTEAIRAADGTEVVAGGRWNGEASVFDSNEDAHHIAHWNPARVLADAESKRRIIDRHSPVDDGLHYAHCKWCSSPDAYEPWPCPDLKDLAQPHAGHPDFNPDWAV